MRVFVLMFNARTDNEGIYTVQVGDRNKIRMFESEDDATRYALMLEAQDFLSPTVEEIDSDEVKQFCQSANYDWEIVSENAGIVLPPETNVEETDWKLDSEVENTDTQAKLPEKEELSDAELNSLRRKLEGLL